jgi:phosphatidylglycerophosphate synthase
VDRLYLLAPAVVFAVFMLATFVAYCGLIAIGRPPQIPALKSNEMLGPFWAGYLVWLMGPIERLCVGRVSPNAITALSLAMCAATGVVVGAGNLAVAVWLYTLAGGLDILDGRIARLAGKQTQSGALFDSVSDRWGELFVFGGYIWYLRETPWLVAAIGALGASQMVSYTRARAEGLGINVSGGMMQRAERILVVVVGTLAAVLLGLDPDAVAAIVGITLLITTATSTATAVSRWVAAFRVLAQREAQPPVVVEEPSTMPLPPVVSALTPGELKIRPVEQH